MHKILQSQLPRQRIVSAATEGNHGRAVAWMARKMGLEAVIYLPSNTSPMRIDAIEREGAKIIKVKGSYEDTVRQMAIESSQKQYLIISDTGYEGYTEIPKLIAAGYFTLFSEVEEQITTKNLPTPDYVFLQGGVGAFASSGIAFFAEFSSKPHSPTMVTVEPLEADCLLASAKSTDGSPQHTQGTLRTRMSALNCGFPSTVAWPIVRSGASLLMAVADDLAIKAASLLNNPSPKDSPVYASESGAAGLAGLLACCQDPDEELPELLGLGRDSNILIVNTEGPLSRLTS
jgi:diaminopropionate ammonia-lyase